MKTSTSPHSLSLRNICLLFLYHSALHRPTLVDAIVPLTLTDLDNLVHVFSGDWDNSAQHKRDVDNGTGPEDFHFLIKRFHVPVRIPDLQKNTSVGSVTRQVYMEQYYNNGTSPSRIRFFNFVLQKGGHLEMETQEAKDPTPEQLSAWRNWRTDRKVFEDICASQLTHDPACNVAWTKTGAATFAARTQGNDCVFTFRGREVYLDSKVEVNETTFVQDEKFVAVDDGSKVAGTLTPFLYDKVASVDPLPPGSSSRCYAIHRFIATVVKGTGARGRRRHKLYVLLKKAYRRCFGNVRYSRCSGSVKRG